MRYTLENEQLIVEIDSHGAELKSVRNKKDNKEYMWQGDPKYWGRTSPILFPIVGGLKDKRFIWKEKEYPMGQHGFARDKEFNCLRAGTNEARFVLDETADTLEKYPFRFHLEIGYELIGDTLKVIWEVISPEETDGSSDPLYFSIGAHPAFNCPIHGEESKTGYRLVFPGKESLSYYGNETPGGLADEKDLHTLTMEDGGVTITEDFFDRCTYIIDEHQTGTCGLADPEGKPYVMVTFDMPLFAVWSPEKKQAPFVCIEPWCGRCDSYDYEGTLENRRHGNKLEKCGVFETSYEIRFM